MLETLWFVPFKVTVPLRGVNVPPLLSQLPAKVIPKFPVDEASSVPAERDRSPETVISFPRIQDPPVPLKVRFWKLCEPEYI